MRPFRNNLLSRRDVLRRATLGFGSLALADLLSRASVGSGAINAASTVLGAHAPHFAPRAKRVIYIFLDGGLSQVDSYDYKPRLQIDDGKPLPASIAKPKFSFAPTGHVLASPFAWRQHGRSGAWASDLFPEVNKLIDELCFIKSLHHDNEDHFTAKNMIATGSGRETRPPVGSWVAYGLGTENENLPAFVEIMPGVPKGTPAAFLPARYAGTAIGRPDGTSPNRAWDNLLAAKDKSQRRRLDLVQAMNAERLARSGPDAAIESEIQNMELAFRMQTEAPDLLTVKGESEATRAMYGIGEDGTDDFGRACLMARR